MGAWSDWSSKSGNEAKKTVSVNAEFVLKAIDKYSVSGSHTHTKSDITDFPTSLPANGGTADSATTATHHLGRYEQDGYVLYAPKESNEVQRIRDNGGRKVAVDYADEVNKNFITNIIQSNLKQCYTSYFINSFSGERVHVYGGLFENEVPFCFCHRQQHQINSKPTNFPEGYLIKVYSGMGKAFGSYKISDSSSLYISLVLLD
jgi:hypothetical protein